MVHRLLVRRLVSWPQTIMVRMVNRLLVRRLFSWPQTLMVSRLFCSPQICIVPRHFYSPRTVFIVRRLVAASTHWTLLRHQPSAGSISSLTASFRWNYFIVDLGVDRWPTTAGLSSRVMTLSLSATGLRRRLSCATSLFVR